MTGTHSESGPASTRGQDPLGGEPQHERPRSGP